MSFLNSIGKLFTDVAAAVKPIFVDFATERQNQRQANIQAFKEWFDGLTKPVVDTLEKAKETVKDTKNKYEREHDMTYFLQDGKIEGTRVYENTDEGKAQVKRDYFLLTNFFGEPKADDDGNIVFELNEYGKILAGEDGIISKDELLSLDSMLKNGKVSQKEINSWKTKVDAQVQEMKQPTDLMAFLDKDGFLPTELNYVGETLSNLDHDKFLLENLYEQVKSDDKTGGVGYKLNAYGLALAGEDGKISKEELKALDTNNDNKVTADEVEAFKAKVDAENKEKAEPTDLAALIGENDMLPDSISYDVAKLSDKDLAVLKKYHILIENFMEDKSEDDKKIELGYNDYALALAGKDGKISKEELMTLDTNKDGKITQDEIDAWKEKVDADKKEKENPTSLATYAEKYGDLQSPLEYSDSEADKAKLEYDKLLLETLYKKVETEDGSIKYEFNDFAKTIKGEDGKISKEELMALDTNKDGKVTKEEISAAEQEKRQPTDIASFLNTDGTLPSGYVYKNNKSGKDQIEHDKNLLDAFYELDEEANKYATSAIAYKMNKYAELLAGNDGTISKEELMKLDTNKDGKVAKAEIDAWKASVDEENEKANPTSLSTYLKEYGEIKSPMEYDLNNEADKAKMEYDKLLLETLYTKVKDKDGKVKYVFNENAMFLAGADGKIKDLSKEELMKLDADKDGNVTKEEVDKFASMKTLEKLKLMWNIEEEKEKE